MIIFTWSIGIMRMIASQSTVASKTAASKESTKHESSAHGHLSQNKTANFRRFPEKMYGGWSCKPKEKP